MSFRYFRFISRNPRLILAVALLLSSLSIIYTLKNMEFLTGRDDLMPRNAPFQVDYRAYRAEFGDQEEIVCVLESSDPNLTSTAADALYLALSKENGLFRQVFYPGGLPYFRRNGLLFMPLEDLQKLRSTLTLAAPVLKELADTPTIQTLFTSLTTQIDGYLFSPDSDSLKSLTFMLSTLNTGFKGFDGKTSALSLDSFLKGRDDGKPSALENAGKQQVITLLPVKEAGSFIPAEKAILKAREALTKISIMPQFKGVSVGLTGVPVLEYEEMYSSQNDMKIATVLSLTLTVALLFYAFRGVLNVFAAMVSLLVGISLSFGFATFAVGHLNILSMVFAIMLIGLGIEYGIQVVLRYQEELSLGNGQLQSVESGIRSNLRSIIWAAMTTAMAFITFTFTDFKGISELGIIAAGGILFCVLATFTVLPAMLVILCRYRKNDGSKTFATKAGDSRFEAIFRRPGLIIVAMLVLSALCLYPAINTNFDYNLMNLQAKGLQSVEYAYKLMRSKENSGYFAVATASDMAEAVKLTERLEALPAVDHVVTLASLVPDKQEQKNYELAAMRSLMANINPKPYQEDLKVMELPTVFERFRESVAKLKLKLEAQKVPETVQVSTFLSTLDTFFASLEKEKDRNALGMLREFQGGMFAEMPAKLNLLKESLNVQQGLSLNDVPQELKQRFVGKNGGILLQVAPKKEIFERGPLQEFVGQVKSVYPHATGEPIMVYESLTVLRDSYTAAFGYAFFGILTILLITFRSIRYATLGILPLIAGLLFMVGGMALCKISFNSANIIVLPLILGVGIDSAIYIINRYRQGSDSASAVIASSAGRGVFLNALTVLFSFGALMVAHHQGVFSIGAVMSIGMASSVVSFLLFLPAMLQLWGKR